MKKILLALAVAVILPTTSCTRNDDEPTAVAPQTTNYFLPNTKK